MSRRLIKTVAGLEKVCKNITLPAQAGSNEMLKAMRRGYTIEAYKKLVYDIRSEIPDVGLVSDIIVGFPSETVEQYQKTVDLLTEIRYDTVHIAAYSPRPGTMAAREMTDDVSDAEKVRRLTTLEEIQKNILTEINASLQGKIVEVLVEGKQKGKWFGRTGTDKLVFFENGANHVGKLLNLKIEKTSPWSLQGTTDY
jgi:tRNA-2-methylthio-N6-dimethylallyladenosine synthase